MVFCPNCGKENADDAEFCMNCSEILTEEEKYVKVLKTFDLVRYSIYALFGAAIVLYWLKILPGTFSRTWLIAFAFVVVLISLKTTRKILTSMMTGLWFGGASKIQCPECEDYVVNENYCIKCGYNLGDVIFYSLVVHHGLEHYVEVNKNYFRVYQSRYHRGDHTRLNSTRRVYYMDKIENLELGKCKQTVFSHPCVKFNYDGRTVEIFINDKIKAEIESHFANKL